MPTERRTSLVLLCILALAAALRFYGLDVQSLSNDELSTWRRSHYDGFAEVMERGILTDVHPPAYQSLMFVVERYVGDSAVVLRMPSAVAGVFAVFAIFFVTRRLYGDDEALLAATLLAVLWYPIHYSQEARAYSLLLLFTLLATGFWIDLLRRERSPITDVAYVVTASLACYLHYFGLLLVALQGLGLLLTRRRRALLVYGAIALIFAPWVPSLLIQMSYPPLRHLVSPTPGELWEHARSLFDKNAGIAAAALALSALGFLYDVARADRHQRFLLRPGILPMLWLVAPVIATALVSLGRPVFSSKNLIVASPAVYILLARALTLVFARVRGGVLIAAGLVATALTGYLVGPEDYYRKPRNTQFREAVAYVVERDALHPQAPIVGCVNDRRYLDYYFERLGSRRRVDLVACQAEDASRIGELVERIRPSRFWLVEAHRSADPTLQRVIDERFALVEFHELRYAAVRLYSSTGD